MSDVITKYGIEFLTGSPFGGLNPDAQLEPAEIDTVAVGDGSEPMPKDKTSDGANTLTNRVTSFTAPSTQLSWTRAENDPTIILGAIDLVPGLHVTVGKEISEMALIVDDPQVTTDPDGNLLDQIVVFYSFGTPTVIGDPDNPENNAEKRLFIRADASVP